MTPEQVNELIRKRRSIYPNMMTDKPISDEIYGNYWKMQIMHRLIN